MEYSPPGARVKLRLSMDINSRSPSSDRNVGSHAQMQLANHLPHTTLGCMQVDFAAQVPQIDISTIMVFGNDLVASAVVA
jgi:hypothetical protein